MHFSSIKGSVAFYKVCADLTSKGYVVSSLQNETLPYDLIVLKDNIFSKIQIKYSDDGYIRNRKRKGSGSRVKYASDDFDYYAIYNSIVDKCIYPSISYGGSIIRFENKRFTGPFYWWEDFLEFTDNAEKRNRRIIDPSISLIEQLKLEL